MAARRRQAVVGLVTHKDRMARALRVYHSESWNSSRKLQFENLYMLEHAASLSRNHPVIADLLTSSSKESSLTSSALCMCEESSSTNTTFSEWEDWSKYLVAESRAVAVALFRIHSMGTELVSVLLPLENFLISCVDFGTGPSRFTNSLTLLKFLIQLELLFLRELFTRPLDGSLWRFLNPVRDMNVLLTQSLAVLHFLIFVLAKFIAPSRLRKSHSIVYRDSGCKNIFDDRLQTQLEMANIGLGKLFQQQPMDDWNMYVNECIFLTSRYVREGTSDRSLAECLFLTRNRRFFINNVGHDVPNEEEWIPFEPIDFSPDPASPTSSVGTRKRCFCWW